MPRSQGLVGSNPTSGTGGSSVTSVTAARTAARALAVLALLAPLFLAERADAQYREFVGRVVSIDAQSLVVKDRRGNKVSFARADHTAVEGNKSAWDAIATGDKVIVRWKLTDGTLWRVIVLEGPPKG